MLAPLFLVLAADVNTPLLRAVNQGDRHKAALLLSEGADPKAANRYGVTPLSVACTNGDLALVKALLDAGADPNTELPGGETVLMTAARTGSVDVIKALLARGARVDAQTGNQTALMWAAAEGNTGAVTTLIEAGAAIDARDAAGFTPLLFAVREGRIDTARALIKAGADVNESIRTDQFTGAKIASGAGAPRIDTSALMLAVVNGHFELAANLLDLGADPDASGPGYTALHLISQVRKPGGGDNDPPPQGSGNLSSLELVKKLAEHGADLNARMTKRIAFGLTGLNTAGATPFLLAAKTADAPLMRALAALGADPSIPNADHSTALMAAAGLGTRSPGEDAGTGGEVVEAMKVALDLGANVNAVDDKGETAMHAAAYKNEPTAVKFLAANGADAKVWNKKNKHGWTPLTIARGYRFGNFKPSPETVDAITQVMKAAGVPIPPEEKPAGS